MCESEGERERESESGRPRRGPFPPDFKGETLFVEVQQNVHNQFLPRKKQKAKTNENQKKNCFLKCVVATDAAVVVDVSPGNEFLTKKRWQMLKTKLRTSNVTFLKIKS